MMRLKRMAMWVHRLRGHAQHAGRFFDHPSWRTPVHCSCGRTWYW